MTEIICPLCGKSNPPELDECQYCQAPLKTGGFLPPAPEEGETSSTPPFPEMPEEAQEESSQQEATYNLGDEIPDWLKATDAGLLDHPEDKPEKPAPDDLSETIDALINQPPTQVTPSDSDNEIPDWLKATEAGFLDQSQEKPAEPAPDDLSETIDTLINQPPSEPQAQENAIDDEWLAGLLAEAGAGEAEEPATTEEPASQLEAEPGPFTEETTPEQESFFDEEQASPLEPAEKPDWLANLEASSTIKLEGGMYGAEPGIGETMPKEVPEEESQESITPPEWLSKAIPAEPTEHPESTENPEEKEEPIAAAELPTWLEALRPSDATSASGPVEDVSSAEVVTAGPLSGLRGVLSPQPSAIRPQKPPTYSIKLRVTEEQQDRMQMMEELLANEDKPKPLPTQHAITSQNIFRVIIAVVLLLPMFWMVIRQSQQTSMPQPGNIPGVIDFTQRIQMLPSDAAVLVAFDYEAGFAGEINLAASNVITQLMNKNAYLALVSTMPSGPAMAESVLKTSSANLASSPGNYQKYANLGYIPGGTMGLLGLVTSPKSILPYSLDGSNVWAGAPLNTISSVNGFSAVIVMTNDPDIARIWIEQVGPKLKETATPLLIITSAQAEPLIRPYFEGTPAQVQGLIAGIAGGIAYARTIGNTQNNGVWDAYSVGITVSILIILVGSIAGVIVKMMPANKKMEN